jgi:hypothetical protein
MPEFLRDPFWQFVGATLALVGIAVSVVLYYLQRRRKALSYDVVSRTPLMSVKEEVQGRVQILFDGTPVSAAHMVVIRVTNSGNVPIVPSDFLRPLKFGFGETVQILSAEIMETSPSNVEASLESDSKAVVLTPVLLNAGDTVTFKVLLAQFAGKIEVDGRVVGVKQVQTARDNALPYVAMLTGIVTTMTGFFLLLSQPSELIGPTVALAGYVLMFLGLYSSRRSRKLLSTMFRISVN